MSFACAYITLLWICILYLWSSFVHMPSSARLLQSLHSLFPKVGRHLPLPRMTSWWPIANDKNSHGVVCSCKLKPNVNWHPALSHSIVVCPWWSCGPKNKHPLSRFRSPRNWRIRSFNNGASTQNVASTQNKLKNKHYIFSALLICL